MTSVSPSIIRLLGPYLAPVKTKLFKMFNSYCFSEKIRNVLLKDTVLKMPYSHTDFLWDSRWLLTGTGVDVNKLCNGKSV